MLNETNFECFLILAETLSFTRTAQRVYLTQQAVSKNINSLESSLGFPLFVRSVKGIALTPEGEECRELFSSMQTAFAEKTAELRERVKRTFSTLRVGYQNYLELGAGIIDANGALRGAFPESRVFGVRYSPGELNRRLSDGTLDLIITCKRYFLGGPEFEETELFRVPSTIMVSPDNPNVSEDATYMDFRSEPYILDRFEDESAADFNRRVKSEIDMCSMRPSNIITVPNRDSAYSAAELGNGVILGSEISQTARGSRLLRYRTGAFETITCFYSRQNPNALAAAYAGFLKKAYAEGTGSRG